MFTEIRNNIDNIKHNVFENTNNQNNSRKVDETMQKNRDASRNTVNHSNNLKYIPLDSEINKQSKKPLKNKTNKTKKAIMKKIKPSLIGKNIDIQI